MAKEVYEQEYGAKFTSFAGRVYPFERDLDVGKFSYNPKLSYFLQYRFWVSYACCWMVSNI